ncbi:MAG: CoA transferase [Chloroflexota bacterium]|nr:CoA transferase [Chloroflexota bacterium]
MAGSLEHIKVIDFGHYIAGPLTGMLLADQGADVIKVDPPGGPRWNTPANATWNRGKRSILLDLKSSSDLDIARELIQSADVVIENFRPGVMDRLGLGSIAMTDSNRSLIYCSIPGFASDDSRANMPAYEGIIGAATATYRTSNLAAAAADLETNQPKYTAIPIASVYGAFQSATAITMALNARERSNLGQRIEVPLFDSMFQSIGVFGAKIHNQSNSDITDNPNKDYQQQWVSSVRNSWTDTYQCKDGRWLRFTGTSNKNWNDFLDAAGVTLWGEDWTDRTKALDEETREKLKTRARELFASMTSIEWEQLMSDTGSEGAICLTGEEWLQSDHAKLSEASIKITDPDYGDMLQPGLNVRMSLTPGRVKAPAPRPNQHRSQILSELKPKSRNTDHTSTAITKALQGIKVLDLCIVLSGPTMGRTLAEYGAEVVKIDNPYRGDHIERHYDINRGKRSLLLDLKTDDGKRTFLNMVKNADIVAQNYRLGSLDKLGLGYEDLKKVKPDIIYASLNAYGQVGPWAKLTGHESIAQAATGMMTRSGGNGKPGSQANPVNDYGTGFMGAYGVALALLHRQRTGEGQHIDSSLAYTASTLQSQFLQVYDGKVWNEPSGPDALGSSLVHRAYQAQDGWFFLGAKEDDIVSISNLLELADDLDSLQVHLEERFLTKSVSYWTEKLLDIGVGAHEIINGVGEVMAHPWAVAHGLTLTRDHGEIGLVTTSGPSPRLSMTPVEPGIPAQRPGSNADEIMRDYHMEEELPHLINSGVIVTEGVEAGF